MVRILPGLLLCAGISAMALALEWAEAALFGRAWIEALVLAILAGTAVRSAWSPPERWRPGVDFSAKFLLEVAVVLLGASLSAQALAAAGPALLAGIAGVVAVSLAATYALGRAAGLPKRMAVLVASGNSICGNSAIAVVAPVIGAKAADVASAIAFTAVLGVAVVLILPLLAAPLALGAEAYGIVAGLTVYAVPQVLAATAPIGAVAMQIGTMVKLVRVLMLGPLVLALSVIAARRGDDSGRPGRLPPLHRLVPWFIIGFLLLALLRSLGWIPAALLEPMAASSSMLMVLAMAALGLGVDVRAVAAAGRRLSLVVTLSLLLLGVMALGLVWLISAA
ncbi:MAG TPA: putative sulfate exporter family transporter [Sphingomicrobium sp.]|nr:putative sulfate exporter family transporter [Sphingomicrobium sp.]